MVAGSGDAAQKAVRVRRGGAGVRNSPRKERLGGSENLPQSLPLLSCLSIVKNVRKQEV